MSKIIQQVMALVSDKDMFVADGHHRYETACNYRDELNAQSPLPERASCQFRTDHAGQHERSRSGCTSNAQTASGVPESNHEPAARKAIRLL